jgi:hypothetical protein
VCGAMKWRWARPWLVWDCDLMLSKGGASPFQQKVSRLDPCDAACKVPESCSGVDEACPVPLAHCG